MMSFTRMHASVCYVRLSSVFVCVRESEREVDIQKEALVSSASQVEAKDR